MDHYDRDWRDFLWSLESRVPITKLKYASKASVQDSSQWSSTQNDSMFGDEGQYPRLPVPSENDSGIFGTEVSVSDINQSTSTSSQHKSHQHHYGSTSSQHSSQPLHHQPHPHSHHHHHHHTQHLSQTDNSRRIPLELPPSLQTKLHTSVSMEDHLADELEIPYHHHRPYLPRSRRGPPVHTLSQQDPHEWHHSVGYMGSPASLSQVSQLPPWQHYLEANHHYRKRTGSPASSDSSSCYNSANERLRSAPGSVISFPGSTLSSSTASSLNSSRSGSKGVLPRPAPSSSRYHPSIPEFVLKSRSEVPGHFPQRSQQRYESESPEDDSLSLPNLPVRKPTNPARPAPPPPGNHRDSLEAPPSNRSAPQAPPPSNNGYRQKKPQLQIQQQDRSFDDKGGSKDSLKMTLDMLIHIIKMFSSKTGKENDGDAANLLLALSRTAETVEVMHQPACLTMLIQIIHNIEYKEDRTHQEVRARAAETLRNIIESKGETRQGKHDLCVLHVLEKVRSHCDEIFSFVAMHPIGQKINSTMQESLHNSCESLLGPMRKLYKYSNDKGKYRPSVLTLGGLQAMAEVLIANYRLLLLQPKTSGRHGDKRICHSSKIVTATISILLSLTYGDVDNKTTLCGFDQFLKALMYHISLQNESIIASGAQVLRNLSWRATKDIKAALLVHGAGITLVSAINYCTEEPTLQYITSALWNLSAHSVESRESISSTPNGIALLVNLLSYNSPSGSMSVVENVGGILKNLSVVIKNEKYRKMFREAGGLAKLSQHLKSKNKTVLANATGILWNLSAHHYEDQKTLWNLGCIPLLDIHRTSDHKSIRENARGALRNLLAFGRTNSWSSRSDMMGGNLKSQKGLSKSVSIAASYNFGHLSQPQENSSESLSNRFSVPLRSKSSSSGSNGGAAAATPSTTSKGSAGSLSQTKSSQSDRRHASSSATGGYQCTVDEDTDFGSPQQKGNNNRLKFKRIASAPQASSFSSNDMDIQDERFSYMPSCAPNQPPSFSTTTTTTSGSKHSVSMEPGYPEDHTYPEVPDQRMSWSRNSKSKNSQSGLSPYGYSYSQDMPLSNDASDAGTSLSILEKMERFDPHHPAGGQDLSYAELEPDEDDDIDQPPVSRDLPPPPSSGREKSTALKFGISKSSSSRGKSHGGTGKLTLDGKGEDEVKPKRSGV